MVTSPNSAETLIRGTTKTITWSFTGDPGANVKIVLLKAGVEVGTISASTPTGASGTGSYDWAISSAPGLMIGSDFKVRVQSTSLPAVTDASNTIFTIKYP